VSVVAREARRRWLVVGGAALALCLLPAAIAALPAADRRTDPGQLRRLVLGSASKPFQGYVDSVARLGLPDLPALGELGGLFGGSTRLRAWYAAPDAWRVAVLDATGERDIYRTATGTQVWDFERNQVTETVGETPIRLPWAADVLPPDLARRLLTAAGDGEDSTAVTALPSRRVAGVRAAGLRLAPTDPDTTVARVDVWADPATGLPLRVEVTGRGAETPVLTTRFLEVSQDRPDPGVLTPDWPSTAGYTIVSGAQVQSAIGTLPRVGLPPTLAGRDETPSTVIGAAVYGTGSSAFVAVALPGRYANRMIDAVRRAGAVPVPVTGGQAYSMTSSVLSMLIVRREGTRANRRTYLLAGLVTPDLLARAGAELTR